MSYIRQNSVLILITLFYITSCSSSFFKNNSKEMEKYKRYSECEFAGDYYRGVFYSTVLDTVVVSYYINYFKKDPSDSIRIRLSNIECDINSCLENGEKKCDNLDFLVVKLEPFKLDTLTVWSILPGYYDERSIFYNQKHEEFPNTEKSFFFYKKKKGDTIREYKPSF